MITIAFLQPGPFEIIVVLFIVLLLFGAKKLPGLARSMGKSLQEFKRGKDEVMRELTESQDDANPPSPPEDEYSDDIESEEDYADDIEIEEEKEPQTEEKSAQDEETEKTEKSSEKGKK